MVLVSIDFATYCGAEQKTDGGAANSIPQVLVPHPSWDCGMPEGVPIPETGELILTASIQLADSYHVGETQYGDRWVHVVDSGTVSGDAMQGTVLPGGLDFQLELANEVVEIEQIFNLVTHDAILVGRRELDLEHHSMRLKVYRIQGSDQEPQASRVARIIKPDKVPSRSWDYRRADDGETRGEVIIEETVTLGPSLMVGASRDGRRNTIPITGGRVSGTINGKVLPGGADYQQLSPPPVIDARYLWQTGDGEVIIIRNAGTFGSLVPTFECRADGNYA